MKLLLGAVAIAAFMAVGCEGDGTEPQSSREAGREVGEGAEKAAREVESAGKAAAREVKEFGEGVKESFDNE